MNNHLTDFPIRPASVVPVGIHPAMIAQTLSVDADRLASALEAAGVEDINAVEVRPHVNAYTGLPGAEVLGVAGQNGFADDPDRYPHIVAMRLDPKRLRAVRVGLDHSQESFAKAIREAGTSLGDPNNCTKRSVQKWESGEVAMPGAPLRRALAAVTSMPFVMLCTPVLPPDPSEASAELSAIATDMNDLIHRLTRLYGYLIR